MKLTKFLNKGLLPLFLVALLFSLGTSNLQAEGDYDWDWDYEYEYGWTDVQIIMNPEHIVNCIGTEDLFFSVVAVANDNYYPIVYRWWKDGKPITSVQEESGLLFLEPLTHDMSGTYVCEIWAIDTTNFDQYDYDFDYGTGANTLEYYLERQASEVLYTDPVNLYTLQKAVFIKDIEDISVNVGGSVMISLDVHVDELRETEGYEAQIQWWRGTEALEDNNRYAGTQSSILTINNVQPSDFSDDYYCVITSTCGPTTSNTFAISEAFTLDFATQPMNAEGCEGDDVQLSVEVATTSSLTRNYQWWLNGAMLDETPGVFTGVNTSTLTITLNDEMDGTEEFVCQVWLEGYQDDAIISDIAGVTVNLLARITSDLDDELTVDEEDEVVLMVDADGENLTYIWYFNGMPLDEESNTLTIESASVDDAGEYYVVITNDCGDVTSNTTILNVTPGTVIASVNTVDYEKFGLHQNTPNPFMSSTTISFRTETPANARLTLMDATGNQIAVLLNETVEGLRQFELNADSYGLTTGTYFYTLEIDGNVEAKKLVLIK